MAATATTPIIPEDIARNTIIGFCVCLIVSISSSIALLPRTWRMLSSWIVPKMRQSSRNGNVLARPGLMKTLGQRRVLLLFATSVLLVVESVNSLVYYVHIWVWHDANSVLLNMIRLFTIFTAGPLMSIATIYRVSLLFALLPRIRRILLTTFTLVVACITNTVYITVTLGVRANAAGDIRAWQSANLFPTWLAPILAMIPMASIVMSVWSLKVAFSVSSEVDAQVISLPPMGLDREESSAALAPAQRAAGVHSSASDQSHGSATSQDQGEPVSYVNPASLGTTFKILTILLTLYWSMFLLIVALYRPFPIHSTAVTATLTALATAKESSFEWLTHRVTRKHMQRRTLNNKVACEATAKMAKAASSASG